MLVGRPNVGKSTLFNRLVGKHVAITATEAGTTRDRIEREITLNRLKFSLVDVGGMETVTGTSMEDNIQEQVQFAAGEADCFLFLVDANAELTADDFAAAEMLRRTRKPVVFVANKFENEDEGELMKFTELGIGLPIGTSAAHNRGIDEMSSALTKILRKIRREEKISTPEEKAEVEASIAIIGRPNVGKTTLTNQLLGEDRFIVSPEACTTRDTNDVLLTWQEKTFRLLDTAGLRRSGKIGTGIDRFATGRTLNAISEADVALLLVDGEEGVTSRDLSIAEKAVEAGAGLVVVVNKIDTWGEYDDHAGDWLATLTRNFAFAKWAPAIFISAETGRHIEHIFPRVLEIMAEREKRISTPDLNRFFKKVVAEHSPSATDTGRSPPKIYYATQAADERIPTFVLFTNRPRAFHFSYRRFVENRLREEFGFGGTPIKLQFRERTRRELDFSKMPDKRKKPRKK